jgi:hypothetical protein
VCTQIQDTVDVVKAAMTVSGSLTDVTGQYSTDGIRGNYFNDNVQQKALNENDERWIIVGFEGDSLIDEYKQANSLLEFSEYVHTDGAVERAKELTAEHNVFLDRLDAKGIDYQFKYSYSTLNNGVAIKVKRKDVATISKMAGVKGAQYTSCTENPSYHPGRCATVTTADGKYLAVFGQIHPVVADNYGMNIPVLCAEIDFDALFEVSNTEPDYKPLPKFPAATRDYAFVCAEELEVGKIMNVIAKAGGALVEKVELFDIFRGEKLGAGNKSVAFRVTLRAADRTLTVEEADKISKKIVNDLKFKLGIALRA